MKKLPRPEGSNLAPILKLVKLVGTYEVHQIQECTEYCRWTITASIESINILQKDKKKKSVFLYTKLRVMIMSIAVMIHLIEKSTIIPVQQE
jgi:hypothetical protein